MRWNDLLNLTFLRHFETFEELPFKGFNSEATVFNINFSQYLYYEKDPLSVESILTNKVIKQINENLLSFESEHSLWEMLNSKSNVKKDPSLEIYKWDVGSSTGLSVQPIRSIFYTVSKMLGKYRNPVAFTHPDNWANLKKDMHNNFVWGPERFQKLYGKVFRVKDFPKRCTLIMYPRDFIAQCSSLGIVEFSSERVFTFEMSPLTPIENTAVGVLCH